MHSIKNISLLFILEIEFDRTAEQISLEQLRNFHFCFLVSFADGFIAVNVITQGLACPFWTAAVDSDSGGLNNLDILQSTVVLDPQTLPRTKRIPAVLFIKLIRYAQLRGAVAQFVWF